jgi:hypothetical protein
MDMEASLEHMRSHCSTHCSTHAESGESAETLDSGSTAGCFPAHLAEAD